MTSPTDLLQAGINEAGGDGWSALLAAPSIRELLRLAESAEGLRVALTIDPVERSFRDVLASHTWTKAQDARWHRSNVWHLLDVLDEARAALAQPTEETR